MAIWKDVEGYEGMYQVSDAGLVRSLDRLDSKGRRIKGRVLKPSVNGPGYYSVVLSKEGKVCTKEVHRLVAENILGRPSVKREVNHKDGDKLNNNKDNLEWVDRGKNMRHAYEIGLNNHNHCSKAVAQYDLEDNLVAEYESGREASRATGISQGGIWNSLHGKYQQIKGFKFKFT